MEVIYFFFGFAFLYPVICCFPPNICLSIDACSSASFCSVASASASAFAFAFAFAAAFACDLSIVWLKEYALSPYFPCLFWWCAFLKKFVL